jgi:hypothetical protein
MRPSSAKPDTILGRISASGTLQRTNLDVMQSTEGSPKSKMADFMPAAVARRNQKIAIGFQKILTNQSKSLKNMIKAGESSDNRTVEKNILLRCNLPLCLLNFFVEMIDALKMAKDEK